MILFSTLGKSQLLLNGSLTGTIDQDQQPPFDWHAQECTAPDTITQEYNTPNVYTFDGSSFSGKAYFPVDTPTFVALRARGKYYNSGSYPPETREFLSQYLSEPLEPNICYTLSVYLCTDLQMSVSDLFEPNISYPPTLEIWGSESICSSDKLLYVSNPIRNTDWVKYNFTFCVTNSYYPVIRFQISWDPKIKNGEPYNGILYVDSMDLKKQCKNDTIYHSLYFKGDSATILKATKSGDTYTWAPNKNLYPKNARSATMLWYDTLNTRYTVTITHYNNCPTIEIFDVSFLCDTLYPKQIIDTLYYKYFHRVTLNAYQGGVKYEWTPKTNLSNPDICCPYLIGFDTSYSVKITDKYGCHLYEYFKIKALCDSLVPEKTVLVMDTTLTYSNKETDYKGILLKPKAGSVNDCSWSPLSGLLISDNCQTSIAKPLSEKTYSVQVIDSFRCTHYEKFNIKILQYFPNFITPNGDGHNDCFVLYGLPDRTSLKIFDKSGTLIFSASPYNENNCWKGNDNKGNPLSTGTYWYVLENKETGLLKKGFVFLKR